MAMGSQGDKHQQKKTNALEMTWNCLFGFGSVRNATREECITMFSVFHVVVTVVSLVALLPRLYFFFLPSFNSLSAMSEHAKISCFVFVWSHWASAKHSNAIRRISAPFEAYDAIIGFLTTNRRDDVIFRSKWIGVVAVAMCPNQIPTA